MTEPEICETDLMCVNGNRWNKQICYELREKKKLPPTQDEEFLSW